MFNTNHETCDLGDDCETKECAIMGIALAQERVKPMAADIDTKNDSLRPELWEEMGGLVCCRR